MKSLFDDTRHRWIQLGCGPHPLPSPWENYDREVNITKPLPFPDGSVRFLFAEHLIEHVTFAEGLAFLRECRRVLESDGVLRLAFPDVTRFLFDPSSNRIGAADADVVDLRIADYARFLAGKHRTERPSRSEIFRSLLEEHGHKSAWSEQVAGCALLAVGFTAVSPVIYSDSDYPELCNIERHHFSAPQSAAMAETTIIEATK